MKKKVEIPFTEPLISTYHRYFPVGFCLYENPSLYNWYLNEVVDISCNKEFLAGYTSPRLDIEKAMFHRCPHLHKKWYIMEFAKGSINAIIRELLNKGYYVYFHGIDDYYLENKSFYKEQHFNHDGMIYGYDQEAKTFSVYAYNNRWICSKLIVSQKSFNQGRVSMFKQGMYGDIFGIKPKDIEIAFDPVLAINGIVEYLASSFEKYPVNPEGKAHGIVVQDYLVMYLDKLLDGSIPFERMDRRVFRLLWEHKRLMKMRIQKIEECLLMDSDISNRYEILEKEADALRMLYATYSMKKRDSLLVAIRNRLIQLSVKERSLLDQLVDKVKEVS